MVLPTARHRGLHDPEDGLVCPGGGLIVVHSARTLDRHPTGQFGDGSTGSGVVGGRGCGSRGRGGSAEEVAHDHHGHGVHLYSSPSE